MQSDTDVRPEMLHITCEILLLIPFKKVVRLRKLVISGKFKLYAMSLSYELFRELFKIKQ